MRLYEFSGKDPILSTLVVLSNQLKSDFDNGKITNDWTTEDLLNFLSNNGVNVGTPDIYDMVKNPPLNKAISSIDDDVVVFKGQDSIDSSDKSNEKSKDTISKMAKKAMK